MQPLSDLACVVHLHSTYSDGTGTVPEIAAAARANALDVVLLTDHDSLGARDNGEEGWHGSVLLLAGHEVSPEDENHFLAFGTDRVIDHAGLDAVGILRAVGEAGGFGFAAHPFSAGNDNFPKTVGAAMSFKALDDPALAGVELWSWVTDVGQQLSGWRDVPKILARPVRHSPDPPPENLAKYDRMCGSRRVAAIGGLDAHQIGVRILGKVPVRLMSYRRTFSLLRTHLLVTEQLDGTLDHDRALVFDALREGRAYIAFDAFAPARGFAFSAARGEGSDPSGWLPMGGEARFGDGGWRLDVSVPRPADIRLLRDGEVVASPPADAASLSHDAGGPGVYRVEVRLGGRVWILSNPIYLR